MSKWIEIGPRWRSEQAYQVMELLKYWHIPSHVVPEEFSFMNRLLHTDSDRQWPVLVRSRDLSRAIDVLADEGLLHKSVFDYTS